MQKVNLGLAKFNVDGISVHLTFTSSKIKHPFMKTFICILFSVLLISPCFSQDILTYKDGKEAKVKVIEVTPKEIKFKKAENLEGPQYTILKSEVFTIKYENGTTDVFATEPAKDNTPNKQSYEYKPYFDERLRYSGPRVGFTIIGSGVAKDKLTAMDKTPVVTQFGWQFETRLFTLDNGTSGLFEWVLLAGGVEQGLLLPSASMIFGMRGQKGVEFGLGPNLSLTGIAMAFAVGGSIKSKSGKVYFPFNLAIVPSVNRQGFDDNTGYDITERTGLRIGLLVGFNTKK